MVLKTDKESPRFSVVGAQCAYQARAQHAARIRTIGSYAESDDARPGMRCPLRAPP